MIASNSGNQKNPSLAKATQLSAEVKQLQVAANSILTKISSHSHNSAIYIAISAFAMRVSRELDDPECLATITSNQLDSYEAQAQEYSSVIANTCL